MSNLVAMAVGIAGGAVLVLIPFVVIEIRAMVRERRESRAFWSAWEERKARYHYLTPPMEPD